MAICLSNLNRKKESIYYYDKILNECPTDVEAHLGICKSYREIGDFKKAFEFVENALLIFKEDCPKISNLYYEKGMCLFNFEKYNEAIISFEKAIEFSQVNKKILLSDCYYHKGICLLKLNQKEKGFKDFEQAIRYYNNGEIYIYKASYYMDLENYDEAIKSYLKAIEINNEVYGNKKDEYFNVAYCYLQLENFKEAKKYLFLSQKTNENKIKNYFENGVSACEENGIGAQEYLIDFSKVFKELKNKFIDINYYLGICNIELNNYEEAIKNFDVCIKYDNKFVDGYYYKGIAYSKLKKCQKAIENYKKAIECDNNPIYLNSLKNEENNFNILYNNIQFAEIDLFEKSDLEEKKKNLKSIANKSKNNKLININKSEKIKNKKISFINQNKSFNKYSMKNKLNIFKRENNIHLSSSKCNTSRLIDLSKSSKELIKLNLKEKISNYKKNEKIRQIIKNNINDNSEQKNQKKISNKFYKNHLIKSNNIRIKSISFFNKK